MVVNSARIGFAIFVLSFGTHGYRCQACVMLMHKHLRELEPHSPIDMKALQANPHKMDRESAIRTLIVMHNDMEIDLNTERFRSLALDVNMELTR